MAEERTRAGAGKPYTQAQVTKVIEHVLDMLAGESLLTAAIPMENPYCSCKLMEGPAAESRFRVLPIAEQEKLKEDEEFSLRGHFEEWLRPVWSIYDDIFQSPNIYGANLKNLDAVANLINQIVKRDRLPQSNSLQAQQLLQNAWNIVDVCAHNAKKYKATSKLTFFLNLFLGLVIIALAVFRVDIATLAKSEQAPKLAVFITATLLTFLMGVTTFYNPTQRWRELRDNAETMHSEVFKFRTRTGIYEVSITDTGSAETRFMARIEESIRTAVHSAALTSSSFTRLYSKGVYVHGQNPEGGVLFAFDHSKRVDVERPINTNAPIADDHHSPMKPTQYITARLIPLRDYYNSRVPKIYRERKVMTALLLASTAAISIIAFVDSLTAADANLEAEAGQQFVCKQNMGLYTILVAGLASCLTAWQEFKGTDRKLNRYSSAIFSIKSLMLWWDSLTSVDQASQLNISRLVTSGEIIRTAEVQAWADANRDLDKSNSKYAEEIKPEFETINGNDRRSGKVSLFE